MAASITNLFDGAASADAVSGTQALPAGIHMLHWQGKLTGAARVILEYSIAGLAPAEWNVMDPDLNIDAASPHATVFYFSAANVRATLVNANSETSVSVGIMPMT